MPITKWSKHGHTALLVPGHDPPIAIKISMDVHLRPGPTTQEGKVSKSTTSYERPRATMSIMQIPAARKLQK